MKSDKAKGPKRLKKPNIAVRILALAVTSALVLGALALVVYRDTFNLDTVKRWLTSRGPAAVNTAPFTHAGGDKLSVACLDSGVVTVSTAGAHYYSLDGAPLADEVLSMENPVLASSRTTAVAYDAGNQDLFVFRNEEETFHLILEGSNDLLSARVNDSGWLAVTAQQSRHKGAVTVYDSRGEEVIEIGLTTAFAVDAAVSPDRKTVAVATMGQEGGSSYSRLLFFPVNQQQPSAQVDLGSLAVLDLDYEDDVLWVLGEDRLITVTPDGETVQTCVFSPSYLKGCSLGGDGFALLLTGRYRSGSADQALIIDANAQAVHVMSLSSQILDYAAKGDYCGLLSGSRLVLCNSSLEQYGVLADLQAARRLDLTPSGSALLANSQQAWLYVPQA